MYIPKVACVLIESVNVTSPTRHEIKLIFK